MSPDAPRVPYLDDPWLASSPAHAAIADAIRERRAGGHLLNLDRMLLHSPAFALGWNGLLGAVRSRLKLDPALRELAICAVAQLNAAPYEWAQHVEEWRRAGAREEQISALQAPAATWAAQSVFSIQEYLVLALTERMSAAITVPAPLMEAVVKQFGEEITVELVGTIAAYNMVSRFLVALNISVAGEGPSP